MTQLKNHKLFSLYILVFFFAILVFRTTILNAEEEEVVAETKVVNKVYELEINNSPDFTEIKNEVLFKDVKYIAHPEKLQNDIVLSEIIEGEIDYSSKAVQEVNFEVQRYADSKTVKTKIDTVEGIVFIQFIDTTAPVITLSDNSVTVQEGSDLDVYDYLEDITDNSFEEVDFIIQDNLDLETPGEYEVVYTATDSSDNQTSETLTVTVKEKPKPVVKPTPVAYRSVAVSSGSNDVYGALSMINSHRAAAGLNPLQLAGGAESTAATIRAQEAASYLSHIRPDGRHYRTAFSDQGVSHSNVIEILTYSGSGAAAKVNWWMSSSAHRSALMSPSATHIALGVSGNMWAGIVYR